MARLTAASTNCEYPVTIEKHSDVSFLLLAIYETSYGATTFTQEAHQGLRGAQ
jgi:hypothetical protein